VRSQFFLTYSVSPKEGRRKKEEGRRKREEGRGKKLQRMPDL
jgi:hypothetical protein